MEIASCHGTLGSAAAAWTSRGSTRITTFRELFA